MASNQKSPISWDESWSTAFQRFDRLAAECPVVAPVRDVLSEIKDLPEILGLFAIPSMLTLIITPYSCYPDFFSGRRVTVDPGRDSGVTIRYWSGGNDPSPETHNVTVDAAVTEIASLCRKYL